MKYDLETRTQDTGIIYFEDIQTVSELLEEGEDEKARTMMMGMMMLSIGAQFDAEDREIERLLKHCRYKATQSIKKYNLLKTQGRG